MATTLHGAENVHILFIGATGYIGGSVLDRLLAHKDHEAYKITVFTRQEDKARKLEDLFPVATIIGSLDDAKILEDAASKADVVINTADADHLGSAKAILAGLKRKHETSHKLPIYIHTSGTGVLTDAPTGEYSSHVLYTDTDVDQIKSIPESAVHREVDLAIVAAHEAGYVRTYIVLPSTIYAIASGPLFDAKIANAHSIQLPSLIRASAARGAAGTVGPGTNVWPNVHIDECADLYLVLWDALRANPDAPGAGWAGFYFGESGSHSLLELAEAVGAALVAAGKAKDAAPTTFTKAELDEYFGGSAYLGTNCRCRAERARALGWKPVRSTKDLLASVGPEVEAILASGKMEINLH